MNRGALQFWENSPRNLAAERLAEDNLPAHVLDTRWCSRSSLRSRIGPRSESVRRKRLIAMSGGKEASTAFARHESGEVFPLSPRERELLVRSAFGPGGFSGEYRLGLEECENAGSP